MHYHILLTELCNSECRYCYKKSFEEFDNCLDKKFKFDFSSPVSCEINLDKLKKFLSKDKEPVLIFYGGEPLMEIDKIKEIMDKLENTSVKFRMQTNAKFLDKLPMKYLNKITKILVSIDGTKERTDFNRGEGTYDLVMKNISDALKKGYSGEIIARMCISSEFSDLDKQVISLVNSGFNSIHWQIDAGFYKFDYNKNNFEKFVEEYNNAISRLINYWLENIRKGRVLKFYPFLAIIDSLLKNEKTKLRCGAGYAGYAITTDGKIVACPIMNSIEDFKAGTIEDTPSQLKKFEISGRCLNCSEKDLCGGRCLYWNKAQLWPEEGDNLICSTIKHLIFELKSKLPEIKELIARKIITPSNFEYEKYFGPEIIP